MRFFKQYRFQVGRKIEFKDLFGVVDAYLAQQHLSYDSLGYYLVTLGDGCNKLVQKLPQLGPLEILKGQYHDDSRLTNMLKPNHQCDEATIRLAGSKIPRPYNFSYTRFFYRNINFFGTAPGEEQVEVMSCANILDVSGSFIALYRDFEGPQTTTVYLKIEVTDQKTSEGADGYAASLASHLGGVKYLCSSAVFMDPSERAIHEDRKEKAAPIVKAAFKDLLARREETVEEILRLFPDFTHSHFSISKPLNRVGKAHGYGNYRNVSGTVYLLSKRVDKGYFLRMDVMREPQQGVHGVLYLVGPGISYEFPMLYGAPENQQEADCFAEQLFKAADYFEEMYMHEILAPYPEVPDWCAECL